MVTRNFGSLTQHYNHALARASYGVLSRSQTKVFSLLWIPSPPSPLSGNPTPPVHPHPQNNHQDDSSNQPPESSNQSSGGMSSATRVPEGFYQATELQGRAQETSSANSGIGHNESSSNKTQQSGTLPTVTQQASLSLGAYPPEFRQNTRNFRPDSVSAPVSKIKFASSVSLQAILLEGDRLRGQQNVGRSFSIPRYVLCGITTLQVRVY